MRKDTGIAGSAILLLALSLLLSSCASNAGNTSSTASLAPEVPAGSREIYSRSPVIIPADAKTRSTALGSHKWDITSHMRMVSNGTAGKAYEYVGTGNRDENELAKIAMPVTPGKAYIFSALVDPSNITDGKFDLIVDTKDGRASYAWVFHGRGPARRFETAAWQCPPDVKEVLLGMQLVRSSVARGKVLRFKDPVLTEVSLVTSRGSQKH